MISCHDLIHNRDMDGELLVSDMLGHICNILLHKSGMPKRHS